MLSAEQQQIIDSDNSRKLVNGILKKLGFGHDEDLRQDAMCYLCECIQRFDRSKGVKWTTYAYKNIFMFIKRKERRRSQKASQTIDFSSFADNADDLLSDKSTLIAIATGLAECTPEERQIIKLRYGGYKICEIGQMLGYPYQFVSDTLKEIRKKITKNY